MFRKCKECEMLRVRIEHLENEIRRKDEFIDKVKIFYFNQIKGKEKIELDIDLILKLKEEKVSNRKIAKQLKLSEGTIRNRLKELGEKGRNKKISFLRLWEVQGGKPCR